MIVAGPEAVGECVTAPTSIYLAGRRLSTRLFLSLELQCLNVRIASHFVTRVVTSSP